MVSSILFISSPETSQMWGSERPFRASYSLTQAILKDDQFFEHFISFHGFLDQEFRFYFYLHKFPTLRTFRPFSLIPLRNHTCEIGCFCVPMVCTSSTKSTKISSEYRFWGIRGPKIQFWYQFALKLVILSCQRRGQSEKMS